MTIKTILFEGVGDSTLRLRGRFMRTNYVPRNILECATDISSESRDSICVLNFTRSDSDITEEMVSHTTDEDNSSFMDDLNESGPLTYIPSVTINDRGRCNR